MAHLAVRQKERDAGFGIQPWAPWLVFAIVAGMIVCCNSFPALYGDELWSLREASELSLNPGGIGYFLQLRLLMFITNSDWALRGLSLFWAGVSLWGLRRWLELEPLSASTRMTITFLWVLNPFLWVYAQQARFYSFFLATTVLVLWRFRAWQLIPSRANCLRLVGSTALMFTANAFSALVAGALLTSYLWSSMARWRPFIVLSGIAILLLLFAPPVREKIVFLEQRLQNQPLTPGAPSRGLTANGALKIGYTFYSFCLGKRVYPLWWWLTVPTILIVAWTCLIGWARLRTAPGLRFLLGILLLEVVFVFLVAEPLAPPDAFGAAPRHVLFVLPAFLIVLGVGAANTRWLRTGLLTTQVVAVGCLLWPVWSDEPVDLVDWKAHLRQVISVPEETCVIVDGRAGERVRRYVPPGVTILPADATLVKDKDLPKRIVLISLDHRAEITRTTETLERSLTNGYRLLTNRTLFPAQIAVYDRTSSASGLRFVPSRLELPEQDLHLPLLTRPGNMSLPGFMRLDKDQPEVKLDGCLREGESYLMASNFRSKSPVPQGTPVARLVFQYPEGRHQEVVLRAGDETDAWNAVRGKCRPLASWTKRAHLVGRMSYPGAYRQHEAVVWGKALPPLVEDASQVCVYSLLSEGTFYFWGLLPAAQSTGVTQLESRGPCAAPESPN
jgi:hypothetical protein